MCIPTGDSGDKCMEMGTEEKLKPEFYYVGEAISVAFGACSCSEEVYARFVLRSSNNITICALNGNTEAEPAKVCDLYHEIGRFCLSAKFCSCQGKAYYDGSFHV